MMDFRGIQSATDARDIDRAAQADGQNYIVENGAITKRTGCTRINDTHRLNGAVLGIFFMAYPKRPATQWSEAGHATDGELIICAGDSIYSGKF